jgi:hypothetical protein
MFLFAVLSFCPAHRERTAVPVKANVAALWQIDLRKSRRLQKV